MRWRLRKIDLLEFLFSDGGGEFRFCILSMTKYLNEPLNSVDRLLFKFYFMLNFTDENLEKFKISSHA